MSIYGIILGALIVVVICIIIFKALNPKSKACKIFARLGADGFNFTFETNEKSTPSDQE